MLRRRRIDLHLRLLAAAAALVFAPLLSFSLGALDETRLVATILAAAVGALALAEFLLAGAGPDVRAAAGRLDALSGDQALFASALDERLDRAEGPMAELFRRSLEAALAETRDRDPLPRRNLTLLKLFVALVALDAALIAVPRQAAPAADAGLSELRDFVVAAGRGEDLDAERREALATIEQAATREEMIRRADEVWRREEAARLEAASIEEAVANLERALESGAIEKARAGAERLAAMIGDLDADQAASLAARLRELEGRFPAPAEGVDLDALAKAAEGAGAGLADGGPGSRVASRETMAKILVALYDGLGTLPPSGAAATGSGGAGGREARGEAPLGGPVVLPIDLSPADRALVERYFRLRAR